MQFDEVYSRDHFGHRVLHLQAGVHLEEVEVSVFVEEVLDGAGVRVADAFDEADGGIEERVAGFGGEFGARRLFDHFLVAALDGAVTLEEVDGVAVVVGDDLRLDVGGVFDAALQVDAAAAEGALRLGAGALQRLGELGGLADEADAHAAAAVRRLDH